MGTDSAADKPQVSVWPDRAALIEAAAARVVQIGHDAIAKRGHFAWALSGGSTPRPLYERLASPQFAATLDWRRVLFFWSDERCVPADHPDSNYGMARAALLDKLPISEAQVFRMRGEDEPQRAAAAYEVVLRARCPHGVDLALLGMGADGHTASLFPGSAALSETDHWVVDNVSPAGAARLTFTFPALNAANHVLFVVAGVDKAERVREALRTPGHNLPVQRVRPEHGHLEWMLDAQAAGGLSCN